MSAAYSPTGLSELFSQDLYLLSCFSHAHASHAFLPGALMEMAPENDNRVFTVEIRPNDYEFVAVRERNPFWQVRQPSMYASISTLKYPAVVHQTPRDANIISISSSCSPSSSSS